MAPERRLRFPPRHLPRAVLPVLPVLLASLTPGIGQTRTWTIAPDGSGDAPTIQAGIDSAAAGDTVLALPGRFVENIDFLGKAIVVKGSGMGVSILDGSGQLESCVRFRNGEGRDSVLEDFEITGGRGSCSTSCASKFGGGVFILEGEPVVRGNLITGNRVDNTGGGIYCGSVALMRPLIENNVIADNQGDRNCGGIAVAGGAAPIIRSNLIEANVAKDGDGGGIWIWVNTDGAVVTGNQIIANVAGDHGGGIYAVLNSTARPPVEVSITNNLISGNLAEGVAQVISSGGGIWMRNVQGTVSDNTIVENEGLGPDSTWGGGGIAVDRCDGTVIERNIVALSTLGSGIRCTGTDSPIIRNNLGWSNVGGEGTGLCAAWWQTDGNIIDNPYFCDTDGGDYRVASNSGVMTHPAGPLGAFPIPGCGPVATRPATWGSLKTRYETK